LRLSGSAFQLTGKKKLFPAKGKAHSTKKGNNEPTAKPDADSFFSFRRITLHCMALSPFWHLQFLLNILA
jgi:hypothetical protein